jgi:hypothetical protein
MASVLPARMTRELCRRQAGTVRRSEYLSSSDVDNDKDHPRWKREKVNYQTRLGVRPLTFAAGEKSNQTGVLGQALLSPDFGARWCNGALSNSPHLLRTLRSVDCGRVSSGGEDLLVWEGVLPCVCEAAACLWASLPSLFSRPGTPWDSCPERGGPTGHDEGDPPARRKSPHFILLHRGPGSGCWGTGAAGLGVSWGSGRAGRAGTAGRAGSEQVHNQAS